MAHRPLIGVVPSWDDTLDRLWMLPGYFDGIIEAGGIPVMLPLTDDETTIEQLVSQCNGFLVTGGHDVDPEAVRREAAGPKDGQTMQGPRPDGGPPDPLRHRGGQAIAGHLPRHPEPQRRLRWRVVAGYCRTNIPARVVRRWRRQAAV